MRSIADLLREHPFFAGLDEATVRPARGLRAQRPLPGRRATSSTRASRPTGFFVAATRAGRARRARARAAGDRVVDTVEAGEVVGWSWLVPPYRWFFDARAVDGGLGGQRRRACLRAKCDEDPALGYALMQRVAAGDVPAAAVGPGAAARPVRGRPCRLTGRGAAAGRAATRGCRARSGSSRPPGHARHGDPRAASRWTAAACPFAPGQFTMLQAFGVGEVPISISGDPGRPDRLVHTSATSAG